MHHDYMYNPFAYGDSVYDDFIYDQVNPLVTEYSVISAILWCNIFIIAIYFLKSNTNFIKNFTITPLIFLASICILRILFVFDLPFTINIESDVIYASIVLFFTNPLIIFNSGAILTILDILLTVWVIGSSCFLVKHVILAIRSHKRFNSFETIHDKNILDILNAVSVKYKTKYSVRILSSNAISTPMIMGFFKPTIILPKLDLSEKELHNIFSHELTHFINKDSWIKIFVYTLCIVFWWNPFIHIFKKNLDYILEVRCDTNVTKIMTQNEKNEYLETILKIVKYNFTQKNNYATANSAYSYFASTSKESVVEQRFKIILNDQIKKRPIYLIYAGLITLFLASTIIKFQPAFYAEDFYPDDYIDINSDNSYLVELEDGTYDFYVEDEWFDNIREIDLLTQPYSLLEIREE